MSLVLKWAQRGLFAGAILMLGYCGFVLADTWMFQHREKQRLERLSAASSAIDDTVAVNGVPSIGQDGLIGRIEIPRLGVSVVVVEGTGEPTLRRAAGHIARDGVAGTARQHRNRRAPRHVFPPFAEYPARRHHHADHVARRVSLPGRVYESGQPIMTSPC